MTIGRIHSFQSLGTIDGPGVRLVVFMQGCNLRCGCCHNPDTWDISGGKEYTASQVLQRAIKYKDYFGQKGGITVSGGEPLMQADFVRELFVLCHENGINTCLDTSGSILNDSVTGLLDVTDRVLLDIKYTSEELYKSNVGYSLDKVLEFLNVVNEKRIAATLRQVIIPSLNDTKENIYALKAVASKYSVVDKIELLPFKKICQTKYDALGIEFPFKDLAVPTKEKMDKLQKLLDEQHPAKHPKKLF